MDSLVENPEGRPDHRFLDDLTAANELKRFLAGRGHEIPEGVARGIGELVTAFDQDIRIYEMQVRYDEWKKRWWHLLIRKAVPDEISTIHEVEKQLRLEDEVAMRVRDRLRKL